MRMARIQSGKTPIRPWGEYPQTPTGERLHSAGPWPLAGTGSAGSRKHPPGTSFPSRGPLTPDRVPVYHPLMLTRLLITLTLLVVLAGCSQLGKITWNFADKT